MFLRDDLALALRQLRPENVSEMARVFVRCVPRMPEYRNDLVAAGIAFEVSRGGQNQPVGAG
jgi:hypothetical protein